LLDAPGAARRSLNRVEGRSPFARERRKLGFEAMAELPSGTVTFLFTDIEGSTRLLKQLGERYAGVLDDHQRILREAFAAHGGHEIDTQGDAFFIAFRRAKDAVAAAIDAQRGLHAHEWPENAQCKVRMGLHSGEPVVGEQRYTGLGVHRAARIAAAGHGGQILVSEATRSLVEDDLPPGVRLRDLGRVQLKDFDRTERVHQLDVEGLPSTFPRLKAHARRPLFYRRRNLLAGALAGVIAAAIAIPIFALGQGSGGGISVSGNAVAVIDPHSNRVTAQVPVGARPDRLAFGAGSLWVANLDDQTVSRIDTSTRQVASSISLPGPPTGLAATDDAVWVVSSNSRLPSVTVDRVDPQFESVAGTTHIPNVVPGGAGSIAVTGSSEWVAPSSGLLTKLDNDGRAKSTIDPQSGPTALAVGDGAVWTTDADGNSVTRFDPSGLVTAVPVGNGPRDVAVGGGGVWVSESLDDAVARIDPSTHAVTATIPVGHAPVGIAVGGGAVWVANSRDGTVSRIDPQTNTVTKTIDVGGSPQRIVYARGSVWVTVDDLVLTEVEAAPSGGTLRIAMQADPDSLDPALAFSPFSWAIENATCVKLVNYPDRPAPAGGQLEPEVAKSLPRLSSDGRTYTFRLRRGFRFSPPSNQPVTAQTFKFAIERALSPRMNGPARQFMSDVVGIHAFAAGKAAHISGVVMHGDTLSIHLTKPAGDFVSRIALPFFCAVPSNTPLDPRGVRVVPAAGPYYLDAATPHQGAVLLRNPNYHDRRPHHFARIAITYGVKRQTVDAKVEAGEVDYGIGTSDPHDSPRLAARYGRGSAAAKNGRQQYFTTPAPAVDFLVLNTHRPLFADARLRRAANYAIDRSALARLGNPYVSGFPETPTDQYLPPAMPGFRDAHVYPLHPDLTAARRLAGTRSRTGVLLTCSESPCPELAQVVKTDLAAIGISLVVRVVPLSGLFGLLSNPKAYDVAISLGWIADYLDPSDFLNYAMATQGVVGPGFHEEPWTRRLVAAAQITGPRRYLTYGRLDAELARDAAPWVAFGNFALHDFFSARIGCQIFQPVTGVDLAALCLRH
jgi:YVTN family beta-propeller protein